MEHVRRRTACGAVLVRVTVCTVSLVLAAPLVDAASDEAWLESYLDETFSAVLERVIVTDRKVTVSGRVDGNRDDLLLAEIPLERRGDDPQRCEATDPVAIGPDGRFSLTLDRFRDRGGLTYDRLTSRWQLVEHAGGKHTPRSHARYADTVPCRAPGLPAAYPTTKKGLGAWQHGRLPDEIESLGVGSVTVNVVPHTFISLAAEPGTFPFTWQGRTYHAREAVLARLDDTFRRAGKQGLMVSAIILIGNPARVESPVLDLLGHPDAVKEGIFAMPNVTHSEGVALYGGLLDLMAERWSRPDGRYGRVHHWIMHNEVDAGYEWTNCGPKPAIVFMDLLQRSLRLMHLITRRYDPHSRTFISLTHHWAHPGKPEWYGSKRMLDLLVRFCDAEGDFSWAVAFHAYPQSLGNPRTWEDTQATFRFDTPKITPRNLEVLEAYLRQPRLMHAGQPRPIHFSENGFNSPDYGPEALADQTAGMAYAWKKVQAMRLAEAWHYHNWIDNQHEGGLRIGLRKFPDEPDDPLGPKPIWHLYRALGTPEEGAAASAALKRIGITAWEDILHRGPIDDGSGPTIGEATGEPPGP
jgi:hypothetical protein